MSTVSIDGHTVRADQLDRFFNGDDGSRVSDEQWDMSRDRCVASMEELAALSFEHVGTECPEGHEIAEEVVVNVVTTDDALGG